MQKKISVIVPIYKVEQYLDQCIESVVKQTYRNLEIILVDDGSPDNCPAMCDEWAKKDKRIKVIHKENGGLSDARNAGLDIATGEFIGFVDSDDYIHSEMYEKMHTALVKESADLCICSCQKVNEVGEKINDDSPVKDEVLTREQCFSKLFLNNGWYYVTAPMKLYKRELFMSLRFIKGKIHEDEFLIHHLFGTCDRVVTISDKLYMYRKRIDSITHSLTARNYMYLIDVCLDRCGYFKGLRNKELAHKTSMSAYVYVVRFIRSGTFKGHEAELKSQISLISSWLLRFGDFRAIKLWYFYIRFAR